MVAVDTLIVRLAVLAVTSGGSRFAWRVVPGLIAVIAAAWAGLPLARLAR